MSISVAEGFARSTYENCEELLSFFNRLEKKHLGNSFARSSTCHLLMTRINLALRNFEKNANVTFTAKLDPHELEYHARLTAIFEQVLSDNIPLFKKLMIHNCQRKMLDHLGSELNIVMKEVHPYTFNRSPLLSSWPPVTYNEDWPLPTRATRDLKDTALKCMDLIARLNLVRTRDDLLPLNSDFQKIISNIEGFASGDKITFKTLLEPRAIIYYDKLMHIYWSSSGSKYATTLEPIEESVALKCIAIQLTIELEKVIQFCDDNQPQLDPLMIREITNTTQWTSLQPLN